MQQGPFGPQALPCFCATAGLAAAVSSFITFPVFAGYTMYLAPPVSRTVIATRGSERLAVIADAILAAANAHGKQTDDQTLLLLRVAS